MLNLYQKAFALLDVYLYDSALCRLNATLVSEGFEGGFSYVYLTNHQMVFFLCFSDTRVKGWFLLDNYIPTFVCSVIYLLIVWLGPKYMKNKQPFSCRRILVVYNIGLTLLSLYMFYEVGQSLTRASFLCAFLVLLF